MSTSIKLPEKPLDEAVWQAWVTKGRAQERLRNLALGKVVKWVLIGGLLAAAVSGVCVLLAPVFSFSEDWQRAVAVASAVPLVTALAWRHARMERE